MKLSKLNKKSLKKWKRLIACIIQNNNDYTSGPITYALITVFFSIVVFMISLTITLIFTKGGLSVFLAIILTFYFPYLTVRIYKKLNSLGKIIKKSIEKDFPEEKNSESKDDNYMQKLLNMDKRDLAQAYNECQMQYSAELSNNASLKKKLKETNEKYNKVQKDLEKIQIENAELGLKKLELQNSIEHLKRKIDSLIRRFGVNEDEYWS